MTSRNEKTAHTLTKLFLPPLAMALVLGACRDGASTDRTDLPMGLGFPPPPPPPPAGSGLPDPRVSVLDEYKSPVFRTPARIALAPDGDIVITDTRAQQVHVLRPWGVLRFSFSAAHPVGLAVDGSGQFYVGEQKLGRVRIFGPDGTPIGALGIGDGEFGIPGDIAWDPNMNTIHVTDGSGHTVKVFDRQGASLYSYGAYGTGNGQLDGPTGIFIDPVANRSYVVDHMNKRIQVFGCDGTWISKFGTGGSGPGKLNRPQGLVLDALGRLYVTDTVEGKLQVLDTGGLHVSFLGAIGMFRGQLMAPMDAVIDGYNRLLVTSYRTRKIVVYGIDDFSIPQPTVEEEVSYPLTVSLEPQLINRRSQGQWITAYVEVPDFSAADLDVASLRLAGLPPDAPRSLGDVDSDGIPDLTLKFSRSGLLEAVGGPGRHTITMVGALVSGEAVTGDASVSVF